MSHPAILPMRSTLRVRRTLLAGLIACLGCGSAAHAAEPTLHVNPTGQDARSVSGGPAAPFETVGYALSRATGGETIRVAPGTYPAYVDKLKRARTVRVVPDEPSNPPLLSRVEHRGGQFVEYRGLRMGPVFVGDHVSHKKHVSRDITISGSEIASLPGTSTTCVNIRNGAYNVTVAGSYIHDCRNGIHAPPTPFGRSHHIQIVGNVLRRFVVDAIQFADWDDVTIAGNSMGEAVDPTRRLHNDMIQLTGRSQRVVIRDNVLHDAAQLLFVQPAFGPIDDVVVENNLLFGSRAYAVQLISATNVRFVNNTLWDNKRGLVLRPYPKRVDAVVPTDTIVANNILSGYQAFGGAAAAVFEANAVAGQSREMSAPALTPEYRLVADSPLCRMGSRAWAPSLDALGVARTPMPSVGAFEC